MNEAVRNDVLTYPSIVFLLNPHTSSLQPHLKALRRNEPQELYGVRGPL